MANVQSPPGFLNIFELLITLKTKVFAMQLFSIVDGDDPSCEKIDDCTVFSMHDIYDVSVLDDYLQKNKFPVRIQLSYIQFTLHNNSKDYKSLKTGICVKEYPDYDSLLRDIIIMINLRRCRNLLSGKHLKAYVLYNYTYHELPAEYWSYDTNWYRLLVDGCAQGAIEPIEDFFGSVYFKKEDIDRCLSSNFDEQQDNFKHYSSSLINLDAYSTPWLQVQSAIYDEYGKDGLAQASKDSVVLFIEKYIEKHELDIAPSDAPDLAKFMRLAAQKAGKKYHAEQKLKKLTKK